MTKASDNDFPSLLLTEQSGAPTSPAAGKQRVYIRTSDHTLVTVNSSGTVAPVGTAGGMTHTYVGYNTVGGSLETVTVNRWYAKSVTLASAGLLTSISVYMKWAEDGLGAIAAGVYTDSSGPAAAIAGATYGANKGNAAAGSIFDPTASGPTFNARWFHLPMGVYLTAGTYWIAVTMSSDTTQPVIYYDGSGSDKYWTPAGPVRMLDGGLVTVNTSANKYSIRGSLLS